ncbi:hypothetical protein P7C70_g1916, partial [Phenoliferia sp. Uapishka_3]
MEEIRRLIEREPEDGHARAGGPLHSSPTSVASHALALEAQADASGTRTEIMPWVEGGVAADTVRGLFETVEFTPAAEANTTSQPALALFARSAPPTKSAPTLLQGQEHCVTSAIATGDPTPSADQSAGLRLGQPIPAAGATSFESASRVLRPPLALRQSTYTAPDWHSAARRPSNPSPTRPTPLPPKSLVETSADLRGLIRIFTVFVPSSLRRLRFLIPLPLLRLARLLTNRVAMALHKRGALASTVFYDLLVFWWKSVISIFFREIRSRGAWKVPREGEGAVIFVVGPHHNQFLDPLLLMSEVRREAGRRISFLTAEKSMKRAFIGQAAKLMQSIPVARPQDMAVGGKGTIFPSADNPLMIVGFNTSFVADFAPRKQIMLGKLLNNATAEVVEVIDDTHLRVKKEFKEKIADSMKDASEGVSYKILPYIDQTRMYSSVYQKLKEGGCIGIFPEGGSHDRTDLLPLKAGVSIMALGALSANPSLRLRIVPVGLSYFHPHRFRSRAVVEFGSPIDIPREFVEEFERGGEAKKDAIGGMMDLVVNGLKSVTIRASDYETLMLIQATRRLYRPPGQHLTLGQIVELNKRFIAGYEVYKDEPKLKELLVRVQQYNTLLRYVGLKDHQVERVARPLWRSISLLLYRFGLVSVWGILALPGVVLNAPIFIAATFISRRKARVRTSQLKALHAQVLVALAGAPTLYSVYAIGATFLAFRYNFSTRHKIYAPVATWSGLPLIGYSALKFGEVGMDVYKSLRPLFLSIVPGNEKQLDKLRTMRAALRRDISSVVNEFGPQLFEDFQAIRIVPPASLPAPASPTLTRRRSTYGPKGENTFLTHPMSTPFSGWVDEYLFGWEAQRPMTTHDLDGTSEPGGHSGYISSYTTDEPADYDEVIHILSRQQAGTDASPGASPDNRRYRRSSRNQSRSQLDLKALDISVGPELAEVHFRLSLSPPPLVSRNLEMGVNPQSQLVEMGFDLGDVKMALQKYGNDLDKALSSLMGEPPREDDTPPPLVMVDDAPTSPYGPATWQQHRGGNLGPSSEANEIVPYKGPSTSLADLTTSDDELPPLVPANQSREDQDLQKALELSISSATPKEDDPVHQAMQASVLSAGPIDSFGTRDWSKDWDLLDMAEKRLRQPDQPVVLRTTSVHLSLLAAYFQCVYAIPSYRHAILSFRPSEDQLPNYLNTLDVNLNGLAELLYRDYWKGKSPSIERSNKIPSADQFKVVFAVQRLFALMKLTKRSFVHITDVETAFAIDEKEYRWGPGPREQIRTIHRDLIDALNVCARQQLQFEVSEGLITQQEHIAAIARSTRIFATHGRAVDNNQHIGGPLPPMDAADLESSTTNLLQLSIHTALPTPDTLYSAIDRNLIGSHSSTFSLLLSLPDILSFEFVREDSKSPSNEKHPLKLEEWIWLDRYACANRKIIKERRDREQQLREALSQRREERRALAVTKDGQDAIILVRTTLEYCQQATSGERDRAARQQMLAEHWSIIFKRLEHKLSELDAEIQALETEADAIFETDDMRTMGPYRLTSLIMRNGLNGRGSAWSYFVDAHGQWWKHLDDAQTKRGVIIDNSTFALELPNDTTINWDRPTLLPSRCDSPVEIRGSGVASRDNVDGIPFDVDVEAMITQPGQVRPIALEHTSKDANVNAAVTGDESVRDHDGTEIQREAMRLRGGAPGDDDDQRLPSDEDLEEEDEAEVELGCLREMISGWDVDAAVGKVGGLPKWLDPTSPLDYAQTICQACGDIMSLLVQLNSPDDVRPHAAARALYVFACRRRTCRSGTHNGSMKVWRVQMPSPNSFYPHSEESEARRKALGDFASRKGNLIEILLTSIDCIERALDSRSQLGGEKPTEAKLPTPLPEWDIECELEPYEESFLTDASRSLEDDGGQGEDADEPDTTSGVDKAFLIFQERVERFPEQVLRFYRLPGVEEPEPLWCSSQHIAPHDVPACSLCGGPRQIEFQILSTLLAILQDDDLHFDSILVYTCIDNCQISDLENQRSGWAEEYVVEQNFASDGVTFGGPR